VELTTTPNNAFPSFFQLLSDFFEEFQSTTKTTYAQGEVGESLYKKLKTTTLSGP